MRWCCPRGRKAWTLPGPSAAPASGGRLQLRGAVSRLQRAAGAGQRAHPAAQAGRGAVLPPWCWPCAGLKRLGLEEPDPSPLLHGGDAARRRSGHPGRTGPGGGSGPGRCLAGFHDSGRAGLRPGASGPSSATLDGGCSSPVAAYARCGRGAALTIRGLYVTPDGAGPCRSASACRPQAGSEPPWAAALAMKLEGGCPCRR